MIEKPANTNYPIHDLIKYRWSPVAFDSRLVEPEKIGSLLEAARWAASCYNEQPWRFIIATKDQVENYAKLLSCIVEANQVWAKNAPLLMISVAKLNFSHNDKPNRHAFHDVGLAMGNLTLQAQSLGLFVHQMGGFLTEKTQQIYHIPQGFAPVAASAIGYPGNINDLDPELQKRQNSPRNRQPLDDLVFKSNWGNTYFD